MVDVSEIKPPLTYKVLHKCQTTNARVGIMSLVHHDVDTPVFMPVGTQVNLKTIFLHNVTICFNILQLTIVSFT